MLPQEIRQQTILRVLIGGFTLVILLICSPPDTSASSNISLIRSNAQSLVTQDLSTTGLIDQIQKEQAALGWVFHKMARDPETMDPQPGRQGEYRRHAEATMQSAGAGSVRQAPGKDVAEAANVHGGSPRKPGDS